jgi:glutathione synthase/RimK-type ligase-like ATP-grasp enzyme
VKSISVETDNIQPSILILASRYDFACDYVISRLRSLGATYFRLNSEDLPQFELTLDPRGPALIGELPGARFTILPEKLNSIYFRRPVFLRHLPASIRSQEDQFALEQWAAFIRSLMLFEECRWINSPMHTYRAEHKPLQLATAARMGFAVPETIITNSPKHIEQEFGGAASVAIKGLDTVFVQSEETDLFGYTSIVKPSEIAQVPLHSAPLIVQKAILDKTDLRVTVVGEQAFCAAITVGGLKIDGDWRLQKRNTEFSAYELPEEISRKCIEITHALGLTFGAIDLVFSKGEYYFLEINPTGEWAWLVDTAGFPLDEIIAKQLAWAL